MDWREPSVGPNRLPQPAAKSRRLNLPRMIADANNSILDCSIERRPDGVLLVRVSSRRDRSQPLPDAVFTFRDGDPQYDYWRQRFSMQNESAK